MHTIKPIQRIIKKILTLLFIIFLSQFCIVRTQGLINNVLLWVMMFLEKLVPRSHFVVFLFRFFSLCSIIQCFDKCIANPSVVFCIEDSYMCSSHKKFSIYFKTIPGICNVACIDSVLKYFSKLPFLSLSTSTKRLVFASSLVKI